MSMGKAREREYTKQTSIIIEISGTARDAVEIILRAFFAPPHAPLETLFMLTGPPKSMATLNGHDVDTTRR